MEPITYHGVTVQRCTKCLGIWFPGIEHKELKSMKGSFLNSPWGERG